jgi:hypothetical protein
VDRSGSAPVTWVVGLLRAVYLCRVVDVVKRRWAVVGAWVALAFFGCGKDQGSDAGPSAGTSASGSGDAGGMQASGNGGRAVGGGTSAGGANAGQAATGGSVAGAGTAGTANRAGSSGATTNTAGTGGGSTSGGDASGGNANGGNTGTGATGTDGGAPSGHCEPGTGFVGQLTGPGSSVPNGGIFTTDPNSVAYGDANLDGVVAAYPADDEVYPIDVDVHDAVVTATAGVAPEPDGSASRTDFWIADEHVLLKVALDSKLGASCCPGFDVRAGMRISFKATEVSTFIGLGQITAASSFVAGSQNNCVLVAEPAQIGDVDFHQMVRVTAQLASDPAPYGGGGTMFWHTGLNGLAYDFLTTDLTLKAGQTITFVGPVSPYAGFPMLVQDNPDWVNVKN